MTFKIATHSFKGGPGKSTITANLAVSLALEGKSVGAMDLDLAGPGLHVIFELKKEEIKHTSNDILLKKCSPTDAVIDLTRKLSLKKGRLTFIPASYKAEDIVKILARGYELPLFRKAVKEVCETYALDYLFIDTHPGIEEATLLAMGACDAVIVVSRIDSQDIFGTGVTLEVLEALKKPVFLVANMIPPGVEEEKLKQRLGSMFNIPIVVAIPFYTDVLRLSSGVFILQNPEHDFALRIKPLTLKLLEVEKSG